MLFLSHLCSALVGLRPSLGCPCLTLLLLMASGCGGKGRDGGANPKEGQGLTQKAESCHAEGRYDCAMESYAALLRLKPRDPGVLNRFAMAARLRYYVTGDADFRDQELDALRRAVRRAPNSVPIQVNLGTTLWEMGMHEEAIEAYRLAMKLEPGHPDAGLIKDRIRSAEADVEDQPRTKAGARPSAKPGAPPRAQPGARPSAQPGARPSAEPGARPRAQPRARPSAKPGAPPRAQPGARPSAEPGARPRAQPAARPSARPGARSGAQPGAQPGTQSGVQLGVQPEAHARAQGEDEVIPGRS